MYQNEYLWSKGLKEFRKQFNIHFFIRSQRPKTISIGNKDLNWQKRTEKFYFPWDSKMVKAGCL